MINIKLTMNKKTGTLLKDACFLNWFLQFDH